MAKAKTTQAPKKKELDRNQVELLVGELRGLATAHLSTNRDGDNPRRDANNHLMNLRNLLLAASDKRLLNQLKQKICAKLRATPESEHPRFSRVRFYIWVVDNVPGANEFLPLLDDTNTCPDTWMRQIKDGYKRKPRTED